MEVRNFEFIREGYSLDSRFGIFSSLSTKLTRGAATMFLAWLSFKVEQINNSETIIPKLHAVLVGEVILAQRERETNLIEDVFTNLVRKKVFLRDATVSSLSIN